MTIPSYKSSIPKTARERVVERYESGAKKKAEYWLNRKQAGIRWFYESGQPELEYALKDSLPHGRLYEWSETGSLTWMEPRRDGRIHGISKQWGASGKRLGTYSIINGTGVDVWRHEREDGSSYLAELHPLEDGQPHGVEIWLDENQSRFIERYWYKGQIHGVERHWNAQGKISRGFPRYWMRGERVNKRQYMKAQRYDKSLNKFRASDNLPRRRLPIVYRGLK
jgi:antitoxin component YwqK of YwqJK toxin-antitoxin module